MGWFLRTVIAPKFKENKSKNESCVIGILLADF